MPNYSFECDACRKKDDFLFRYENLPKFVRCECGGTMQRLFPTPYIRSDNTFMRRTHLDDGFGGDNGERQRAYAKAKAAGVNPEGKKYMPGLCRPGVRYDPQAWVSGRGDVKRVCEKNGWGCEGAVNVKAVERDEPGPDERPYRIADDIIDREVETIVEKQGGKVSAKQRKRLKAEVREKRMPVGGKAC